MIWSGSTDYAIDFYFLVPPIAQGTVKEKNKWRVQYPSIASSLGLCPNNEDIPVTEALEPYEMDLIMESQNLREKQNC